MTVLRPSVIVMLGDRGQDVAFEGLRSGGRQPRA